MVDMRGREDARIFGQRAHRRGEGEALETFAIEIGGAAEAFPAPNRHDGLELHLVRHARESDRALPLGLQDTVDRRHGAAAAKIGAKGSKLQLAVIEKRIARLSQLIRSTSPVHWSSSTIFSPFSVIATLS
jgi:hypothetical protein